MGEEAHVDYVCEQCHVHHFSCCTCHARTIGWAGDEMCERCFRGLVEISDVIRSIAYELPGDAGDRAIEALKRGLDPRRWPDNAARIIEIARRGTDDG